MTLRVGIAGVGGIGSNVAVNLVRASHDKLLLVDFDRVEVSNLNRQFYFRDQVGSAKTTALRENLLRINPVVDIDIREVRLDAQNLAPIFNECAVIVEGFDGAAHKKILLETFAATEKKVVSASGIAGCDLAGIRVRQIGNCHVVGDFVSDCRDAELYAPKISTIGAMMADIVMKCLRSQYTRF